MDVHKPTGEPLREREYSKRANIGSKRYQHQDLRVRSKLISRDERLKAPKSSHFQAVKERLKNVNNSQNNVSAVVDVAKSQKALNNSVDNPYNMLLTNKR